MYVIPWHGITSNGLHLANTGPLDNWTMIIQCLMKSHEIDSDQLNEQSGNVIKTALMLVENRQYADAKFVFLSTNSIIRNGVIDFYGYEADYFIPLFHLILTTEVTTSCSLSTCSCTNTYKTYTQSQVVCHINVVFKVHCLTGCTQSLTIFIFSVDPHCRAGHMTLQDIYLKSFILT